MTNTPADEGEKLSAPEQEDEKLRAWYLARLRSKSKEELTPLALIDVDKEIVKSLAEDWVKDREAATAKSGSQRQLLAWIMAALIVLAILVLFSVLRI